MRSNSLLLTAYRTLGYLVAPVLPLFLKRRAKFGKEILNRSHERLGRDYRMRRPGYLVWVHAASVGEMNAALGVIRHLTADGKRVLLTTGTVTSATLARSELPDLAQHAFAPLDAAPIIERFLRHWHPDLAIFVESEIWPAMLSSLRRRNIKTVLINGRLSDRSFAGWDRQRPFAQSLFSTFDLCLVASPEYVDRFQALGAPRAEWTGNLKYDRPPLAADPERIEALRSSIGNRTAIVAASTHAGEEDFLFRSYQAIKSQHPESVLIVVPRHPERGEDVVHLARTHGLVAVQRSQNRELTSNVDVYVADTLGELGVMYQLADFAFVGGTLAPRGGQNPIEAACIGRFVIHGKHTNNFKDVYRELDDVGAGRLVKTAHDLQEAIGWCIDHPDEVRRGGELGAETVDRGRGALKRTLDALYVVASDLRDGQAKP